MTNEKYDRNGLQPEDLRQEESMFAADQQQLAIPTDIDDNLAFECRDEPDFPFTRPRPFAITQTAQFAHVPIDGIESPTALEHVFAVVTVVPDVIDPVVEQPYDGVYEIRLGPSDPVLEVPFERTVEQGLFECLRDEQLLRRSAERWGLVVWAAIPIAVSDCTEQI